MDELKQPEPSGAFDTDPGPLAGNVPGLPIEPAAQIDLTSPAPELPLAPRRRVETARLAHEATARFTAGDFAGAADLLGRVLELDPGSPAAYGNFAVALWRTKHPARAEALCRRALALDPEYVPAHRLLAELLRERRAFEPALACFERLFALDPDNAIAHNNAGLLLREAGRLDQADVHFARAHALQPDHPIIRFNQLSGQRDDSGLAEALECCFRALEQHPGSSELHTNLGVVLQFLGRREEALQHLERALALDPDNAGGHFNLAILLLVCGDYARGWSEYEHRWRLPQVARPNHRQPLWQGENLDGKTILLQDEQGFGDTIQCLRYVPAVARRGGQVLLRVERTLVRIAASLPGNAVIVPPGAKVPPFDVWCPLLSLPRIFATDVDSIPGAVPFLRPRSALVQRWRQRLQHSAGLKVGLVWAGNPNHLNDCRRSVDLQRLAPLLAVPGVSFISLQVGERAADLTALPSGAVTDLSQQLKDFAETAAAIENLDLVIAVDTAVAHLAGALGRPVWVMLPFSPDWRWLLDREDSPWYPTARLFRQPAPGDWDSVVARVQSELLKVVAESTFGAR